MTAVLLGATMYAARPLTTPPEPTGASSGKTSTSRVPRNEVLGGTLTVCAE